MLKLPSIPVQNTTRVMTDAFYGYNHKLRIRDGEFYDTENLTVEHWPLLASRKKRGVVRTIRNPGGLIEKDALCTVEDGTLYVSGHATPVTGLSAGMKQLVGMGAYICIFPDKVYYNTEDSSDYGSMEADWSYSGSVRYAPCNVDGVEYERATVSGAEPEDPDNGDLWVDTSGESHVLLQWSESSAMWVEIPTVYTKITFTSQGQIPAAFARYDGVELSGCYFADLDGSKILCGVGGEEETTADYIVVVGLTDNEYTDESGSIHISRTLPQMDFVVECQNRLWGCFYGFDGEKTVNEIYCSALGDFKNWRQYLGLSTDSWAGSVGSDGQWTGAVTYLGHPTFFKENRIHMVTVSAQGAHSLDETVCRGVQKGSSRSLQVVGETLYYKGRSGVFAWQGGFPECVSDALGEELYYDAAAGAFGERYYISMRDAAGEWQFFVYSIKKGLWIREDNLHAADFCACDDELYCLDSEGRLLALNGTDGEAETTLSWMAESGILYYEYPDHKYVSRYNIRLRMEEGAQVQVYLQYDSEGPWRLSGTIRSKGTGTVTLPIRPRRCDHLKLRLEGQGEVRIFSIARILEVGSDV